MATTPGDTTELALVETGTISVESINELALAIKEEIGDMGPLELPRAIVPSGGTSVAWGVKQNSDDQRPASTEALDGVVIARHQTFAYYSNPKPVPGQRPDCSSNDGVHGRTMEGDNLLCDECPYNQFKSAVKTDGTQGKGKACRNAWTLYLLRSGELLPTRVKIPPTGVKALKNYVQSLVVPKQGRPTNRLLRLHDVVTRITLNIAQSTDGTRYAVPAFEAIAVLPKDSADALKRYGEAFMAAPHVDHASRDNEYSMPEPEDGDVF